MDASSKKIRMAIEALVHQKFAERFIPRHPGWVVVSTAGVSMTPTKAINEVSDNIFDSIVGALETNIELLRASPFHFFVLDTVTEVGPIEEIGLEDMIRQCEIKLFVFLKQALCEALSPFLVKRCLNLRAGNNRTFDDEDLLSL